MITLGDETTPEEEQEFNRLSAIEPRIAELLAEASAITDDGGPSFCANAIFYGFFGHEPSFKARLSKLVGYKAEREELKSSEVYDVVYSVIYKALPNCRNCMCG